MIGGTDESGNKLSSGERFSPTLNEWKKIAPLNSPRSGSAVVSCKGGKDFLAAFQLSALSVTSAKGQNCLRSAEDISVNFAGQKSVKNSIFVLKFLAGWLFRKTCMNVLIYSSVTSFSSHCSKKQWVNVFIGSKSDVLP